MKVLFYTPVMLESGGGCERWHCDVTQALRKQSHYNTEIVSANLGKERWIKAYLKKQLNGVPYEKIDFPIFLGILIPTPVIMLLLFKKIRNADVVHFIHGFMGQDILMAILKLLTGRRFVVGHHAPILYSSRAHNIYMRCIARYLLNYFDLHQTLNSSDRDFLEKHWKIKNVHFIPSGVRVNQFLEKKKTMHKGLVFLAVGRYEYQKGFDLLLGAIKKFNAFFPKSDATFVFVGSGSLSSMVNEYALKYRNVVDLGYVVYEKMINIYAGSDIFVLSSREEPFGLVLIEAWASGLPVLATKTEGPKDMLRVGINGWYISKISVDGIYEKLVAMYRAYKKDKMCFLKLEGICREIGKRYSIDETARKMSQSFFKEKSKLC